MLIAENGPISLHSSFRYSELYSKEPSSYQQSYIIDLLELHYAPVRSIDIYGGRVFKISNQRTHIFDGGGLSWNKIWHLEAYAGWKSPDRFYNKQTNFSREQKMLGVELGRSFGKNHFANLDYLKEATEDKGAAAILGRHKFPADVSVTEKAIWSVDSNEIEEVQLRLVQRYRKQDQLEFGFQQDAQQADTTDYYEYMLKRASTRVWGGFLVFLKKEISIAWQGSMMFLDGNDDPLWLNSGTLRLQNFEIRVENSVQDTTQAVDARISWGQSFFQKLELNASFGSLWYDLRMDKQDLHAWYGSGGLAYKLPANFGIDLKYEYLQNPVIVDDHRAYFGIRYNTGSVWGGES